jgi:hypothetical protein
MIRNMAGTIQLITISSTMLGLYQKDSDILDIGSSGPSESIETKGESQSSESGIVQSRFGWSSTTGRFPRFFLVYMFLVIIDSKTKKGAKCETSAGQLSATGQIL